ncbi:hypothetical protein [Vallitalea maricola]|uniref:Uncharacterized protein n=1 Tax=Vallitalea maricola TaxID=3074433 RepID=A0ACB5URW7_9FIRM|nr:hypothetical protein AN2V17_44450 [Vallitalea sp. AN17-2]
MFNIKSYIKYPNKKIQDLFSLNDNYKSYFIELNDMERIKNIVNDIDTNYIEGIIYLEYNGTTILDFTYWDIIDQLWAYMITLVDNNLKDQKAEIYFPDQPIKVQINNISNDLILMSIESNTKMQMTLPKYEFFITLIEAAKEFFCKIQLCFDNELDYSYELELIDNLTNILNKNREINN